jgi:hypothetical protein
MVILDEKNQPILIDCVDTPVITEYFWTLNLEYRDFILEPLKMFEEITASTLVVNIMGYIVTAPADWNILIYSPDTSQLDIVEFSELTMGDFTALVFNHKYNKIEEGKLSVVDYYPESINTAPSLQKNMMLCHPLGTDMWCCISPTDNYNKYLKESTIGDLI